MDNFNLTDNRGQALNDFVKTYRDSMQQQYASDVANLKQEKQNYDTSVMSSANRAGMMYSNFPERAKMQYEATTYLPSLSKAYTSYQTGIDSLRSNAVSVYNNIKSLEKAIAELNASS